MVQPTGTVQSLPGLRREHWGCGRGSPPTARPHHSRDQQDRNRDDPTAWGTLARWRGRHANNLAWWLRGGMDNKFAPAPDAALSPCEKNSHPPPGRRLLWART
jgi:hypothetical protein